MYTRKCPNCNKEVSYSSASNGRKMEGRPCKECHPKLLKSRIPKYKNICIECGLEQPVKYGPRVKSNWKCESCRNKKEKVCPICNTTFTTIWNAQTCSYRCMHILIARTLGGPDISNVSQIEHIRKTRRVGGGKSQSKTNNGMWGKTHSPESKRKIRVKTTERFIKSGLSPRVNKTACEQIDILGRELGYTFRHGANGGEVYIKELGYYVDGYDEQNNVVVEYDEPHHLKASVRKKDADRQAAIIKHLECKFIRIQEHKDGSVQINHIIN